MWACPLTLSPVFCMTTALSIKNLFKTYKNGVQALKGIDIEIEDGDFYALLGPNGAGKSTTIGIISSLVNKTSGEVKIFDKDLDKELSQAKSFIGLVPQEFNFNQFEKVYDIVMTQAGYYGIHPKLARERTDKYLRLLGLWEKRNDVSRMLSGGMKRRLMIARALVHEPKLLILDEPTAGVDIELRRSMWAFLRKLNDEGTTIILTTHYLEEAESLCRNVAIIDKGEIVVDMPVEEVLTTLSTETFILDLKEEFIELAGFSKFNIRKKGNFCIEVDIDKNQSLNELFKTLSDANIHVLSMKNKSNRLEEFFVSLVEAPEKETA